MVLAIVIAIAAVRGRPPSASRRDRSGAGHAGGARRRTLPRGVPEPLPDTVASAPGEERAGSPSPVGKEGKPQTGRETSIGQLARFGPECAPTVRLTVRGPEGLPIPEAAVTAQRGTVHDPIGRTDLRGEILVHVVPSHSEPALMWVFLDAEGWAPARVGLTARPSERSVRLRRGRVMRGRLIDEDGRAVPGSRVRARRWKRGSGPSDWGWREAVSGPDGRFEIPDLPKGPLYAEAIHPVYPPVQKRILDVDLRHEVELRLRKGWDLTLRVLDDRGDPLPAARIEAAAPRKGITPSASWSLRTDPLGSAVLTGIPPDTCELRVSVDAPGFAPGYASIPGGDFPHPGIEIELDLPETRVRGRVVSKDGTPLPGRLTLQYEPVGGTHGFNALVQEWTSEDGTFETDRIPANARFFARFSWHPPRSATWVGPLCRTEVLQLGRGAARDLLVEIPDVVPFRLRCVTGTGAPAIGISLRLTPAGADTTGRVSPSASGCTDDAGELELLLPAGAYRWIASAGSWTMGEGVVEVGADRLAAEIGLEEGLGLAGRVRFEDGRPVAGHTVEVVSTGVLRRVTTDDGGEFVVHHLPDEELVVTVEGIYGEPNGTRRSGVRPGGSSVKLVLQRWTLQGSLHAPADDSPVQGKVGFWTRGQDSEEAMEVRTDAEGAFRIPGLTRGSWRLVASAEGREERTCWIDVPADGEVRLVLGPAR